MATKDLSSKLTISRMLHSAGVVMSKKPSKTITKIAIDTTNTNQSNAVSLSIGQTVGAFQQWSIRSIRITQPPQLRIITIKDNSRRLSIKIIIRTIIICSTMSISLYQDSNSNSKVTITQDRRQIEVCMRCRSVGLAHSINSWLSSLPMNKL